MKTIVAALLACAALLWVLAPTAEATLIFGPAARTQFENFQTNLGDTFVDFDTVPINLPIGTKLTNQLAGFGVTFASITNTSGAPAGPFHVYVSGLRPHEIVGAPCGGCGDDGRVGYEIVFTSPQRRAGLERNWNTNTLTQFFNPLGGLLGQHQNTVGTEFVGFIADTNDPNDWIKRIVIDSVGPGRSVGYSDDLFFGSVAPVPEPGTVSMLVVGLIGLALLRRRRR